MNPIIHVNLNASKAYDNESFFGRVRDRFKIKQIGESVIKELGLEVALVKLPPNFNKNAYLKNMEIARRSLGYKESRLAPKAFRLFDYYLFGNLQQKLFAYAVVRSVKLMLRVNKKSIKNSCIVIYDASDNINSNIIFELSKECRYLVLLSDNINKVGRLRDLVVANYGVSPIVTNEFDFAVRKADSFITSQNITIDREIPVWYLNNLYSPQGNGSLAINDVSFHVPWNFNEYDMNVEILGGILSQMGEKDIEASLQKNGIYLDKIKFNENIKL